MKSIKSVAIVSMGLLTSMTSAKPKNKPVVITPVVQTSNLHDNGLWSYGGCYQEVPELILSQIQEIGDPSNTVAGCIEICDNAGYYLAGVESGDSCYCGNILNTQTLVAAPSDCNTPCAGDIASLCGGSNYMNLYQKKGNPGSTPQINVGPIREWSYNGCFLKPFDAYPLSAASVSNPRTMSIISCVNHCEGNGYSYAALYGSQTCFCDDSISWGSLGKGLPSDGCNYACPGDGGVDICGGSDSFSIYSKPSDKSAGL